MRGAIFAIVVATALVLSPRAVGRNVTLSVSDRAAEPVFVEIMRQSGNNYVFPAGLLDGMTVSVRADNEPVERLLARMFEGTGIVCRIEGNNIILSRRTESAGRPMAPDSDGFAPETDVVVNSLAEVVVISSRNAYLDQNSSEIGARSLNRTEINGTPALFGENDVIKVLQTQPGVSGGTEGMASMYVHGGNDDENLFMLDNVPLYQVNHFGGLFSAFNTEAIRQVDFYKSSFPAKYDGRLSSYVDVRTRDGRTDRHSGSFRLGMTSGALSLEGPIGDRTSYSVALRRSWYEVLTIPMMAILSSLDDSDMSMRYAFADLNGRVTHRFSDRSKVYASVYYGYDILNTTLKEDDDRYKTRMRWGNMVASAGWNYAIDRNLFGEFTAAYTRYFSHLGHDWLTVYGQSATDFTRDVIKSDNNIGDAIVKADFDWRPADSHKVAFGTSYTLHSFVPSSASRNVDSGGTVTAVTDSAKSYRAHEASLYIGDDWTMTDRVRVNAGVHASLFAIDGHATSGVSPRLSIRWQVAPGW